MPEPTPAEAAAKAAAEAQKNPRDESPVPGGKYRRAGYDGWVNAEGEPITSDGKIIKQPD